MCEDEALAQGLVGRHIGLKLITSYIQAHLRIRSSSDQQVKSYNVVALVFRRILTMFGGVWYVKL
jgi:hypothetical protein